jgi:hypothetical protein
MAQGKKRTCVRPQWLAGDIPALLSSGASIAIAARACMRAIARVRVFNDSLPLESIICKGTLGGILIEVEIAVPDRDNLERVRPMRVVSSLIVPWAPILQNGPAQLIREIRSSVRKIMEHEVDESFMYLEHRAFDPHHPIPGLQ